MNGMRMKRILLWFLLFCNAVMLAVIGFFAVRDQMRIGRETDQLLQLMESRKVTCNEDVYRLLLKDKTAYTIHVDIDQQNAFCQELLGESTESGAQYGGAIDWSGEYGEINWTTDGTVTGTIDLSRYGAVKDAESARKRIVKLLKKSGMDMNQTASKASEEEDGVTVRVQQGVKGRNLESCELKFVFDENAKVALSGKWCFGEPEEAQIDKLNDSTPADILLAVLSSNSSIQTVQNARQVYVLTNKSGGRFTATPCWKVTTNVGDYIIDPVTLTAVDPSFTAANSNWNLDTTTDRQESTVIYPNGTDAATQTETHSQTDTEKVTDSSQQIDPAQDNTTGELPTETVPDGTVSDGTVSDGNGSDGTIEDDPDNSSGTDTPGTSSKDPELPDEYGIYG